MNNHSNDNDSEIDALARRAGAEVRRPAPNGFAEGIQRIRRRQQTVRAGLGVVGVVAVVAIGAVAVARNESSDTIAPATVPATTVPESTAPDVATTPDSTPGTVPDTAPDETAQGPESTAPPPAPSEPVPQAIYAYADDTGINQDVFDPLTLELIDTIPFAEAVTEQPEPDALSASGSIAYGMATDVEITFDDCGQTPTDIWIVGGDPSGLPEQINDLAVSADGRVGVVAATDCPSDRPLAGDFAPEGSYPITVSVFDPDRPDASARTLLELDGEVQNVHTNSLDVSDDGSFLMLRSSDRSRAGQEGMFGFTKIVDVATGRTVIDIDVSAESNDMPSGDCGFGYTDLQFVGPTAISYVAFCPDAGLAVVTLDLVTGDTAESVNPEYLGRTYESMPSATLVIDRSTYTTPGSVWYLLCAERESVLPDGSVVIGSPTSRPCWIGHGSEAMREIPTNSAVVGASFEPLP